MIHDDISRQNYQKWFFIWNPPSFFYVSLPLEHDYITNDMYFSLHHLITINTYDLFQLNLVTNYAK